MKCVFEKCGLIAMIGSVLLQGVLHCLLYASITYPTFAVFTCQAGRAGDRRLRGSAVHPWPVDTGFVGDKPRGGAASNALGPGHDILPGTFDGVLSLYQTVMHAGLTPVAFCVWCDAQPERASWCGPRTPLDSEGTMAKPHALATACVQVFGLTMISSRPVFPIQLMWRNSVAYTILNAVVACGTASLTSWAIFPTLASDEVGAHASAVADLCNTAPSCRECIHRT